MAMAWWQWRAERTVAAGGVGRNAAAGAITTTATHIANAKVAFRIITTARLAPSLHFPWFPEVDTTLG
jgi:hypothetical protein